MGQRAVAAGGVAAIVAGLGVAQLLPGNTPVARADGLVGYRSCAELLEHYRQQADAMRKYWGGGVTVQGGQPEARDMAGAAESSASAPVGSGPTGTNLQEQGVDEPDVAKLADGGLLVLSGSRLRLLSTADSPDVLDELKVGDGQYGSGELLVVGDRALVVLPGWKPGPEPKPSDGGREIMPVPGEAVTRVVLVDLSGDRLRLLEEARYDGAYVSARLTDGTVRLVTVSTPQLMTPQSWSLRDVLPQVERRDASGAVQSQDAAVTCTQTRYAPGAAGTSTLLISTLRPEDGLRSTDDTAVTTDGQVVYASPDRLYVATSRWGTVAPASPDVVGDDVAVSNGQVDTQIHAFDTTSGSSTAYLGTGKVPGYVYGRWAFSQYQGVLRVATTRQPPWGPQGEALGKSDSMVVTMAERDGRLVETGRLTGLGPTEQIKSVRYFGDLAAVVTFRQTDPLYLLDLSGKPRVIGELKVPGFSTYLHPLGNGLLLGLGMDATDEGQVTGMQASVFDISDPTAPRLVDRLPLGTGHSPAIDDSRAFSYDPSRRMVLLPMTRYDTGASEAVGIRVAGDGTLSEVGRLSMALGQDPYAGGFVSRVLVDDSRAYAVTDGGVLTAEPETMTRLGSTTWPVQHPGGPITILPEPVE